MDQTTSYLIFLYILFDYFTRIFPPLEILNLSQLAGKVVKQTKRLINRDLIKGMGYIKKQ